VAERAHHTAPPTLGKYDHAIQAWLDGSTDAERHTA
jgi:hypothetical protein